VKTRRRVGLLSNIYAAPPLVRELHLLVEDLSAHRHNKVMDRT